MEPFTQALQRRLGPAQTSLLSVQSHMPRPSLVSPPWVHFTFTICFCYWIIKINKVRNAKERVGTPCLLRRLPSCSPSPKLFPLP